MRPRAALLFLFLPPFSLARLVNITIDDQNGDPQTGQVINYNPPEAWQPGQTCSDCTAKPSPASNAYMGTWQDASYNPNDTATNSVPGQVIQASVPFIGVAVYVNVILTGSTSAPDGNTDYTFKIDNVTKGEFQKTPDGNSTYLFNQTVFAITGLDGGLHTLTIESGHNKKKALVLLDSITYTKNVDDDSSNSTSSTNSSSPSGIPIGVIVGPIIGGLFVLGAALALIFYMRRQRRNQGVRITIDGDEPDMHSESYAVANVETRPEPYFLGSNPSANNLARSNTYLMSTVSGPSNGAPSESSHSSFDGYGYEESAFDPHSHVSPPAYSEVDSSIGSSAFVNPYKKS